VCRYGSVPWITGIANPFSMSTAFREHMTAMPGLQGHLRIVVSDDDPNLLGSLTSILRSDGHCVFAAYDGRSALELTILLPEIDLLVTNTRLGDMGWAELVRQVRQQKPTLRILHVATRPEPEGVLPPDVPTLLEPFTPARLLEAVEALVSGRRTGDL
jgi:DNA-binding response OmpR family regulator